MPSDRRPNGNHHGNNDLTTDLVAKAAGSSRHGFGVVAPFGGGFTTAACCLRLGLRCVSCDEVERVVNVGKYRLKQVWDEMEAAKRT